jgi:hypothetical protein
MWGATIAMPLQLLASRIYVCVSLNYCLSPSKAKAASETSNGSENFFSPGIWAQL